MVFSARLRGGRLRLLLALPGGCPSSRPLAGRADGPPGARSVHAQLEKTAARRGYERGQEHHADVSDQYVESPRRRFQPSGLLTPMLLHFQWYGGAAVQRRVL